MSVLFMARVWPLADLTLSDRLVLLALADWADDTGRLWPYMEAVAAKVHMTERGTRQIVRRLEAFGYVETKICRGAGKRNLFILRLPAAPAPDETRAVSLDDWTGDAPKPAKKNRNGGAGLSAQKNRNGCAEKPERLCRKTGTAVPPIRQDTSRHLRAAPADAPAPAAGAPFGAPPLTADERARRARLCAELGLPVCNETGGGGDDGE